MKSKSQLFEKNGCAPLSSYGNLPFIENNNKISTNSIIFLPTKSICSKIRSPEKIIGRFHFTRIYLVFVRDLSISDIEVFRFTSIQFIWIVCKCKHLISHLLTEFSCKLSAKTILKKLI